MIFATCLGFVGEGRPDEMLDQARQACVAAPGVSYSFVQHGKVGGEECTISGTGRQARSQDAPTIYFTQGLFRFEGTIEQDKKSEPFAIAYDGENLFVRNPGQVQTEVIRRPTMKDVIASIEPRLQLIGMPPLTAAAPFEGDGQDRTVRAGELLGRRDVAGVACDLQRVHVSATAPDGTKHDIESVWAFGGEDHLPRQHEGPTGTMELRDLCILSADDAADRASFRLPRAPATRPADK